MYYLSFHLLWEAEKVVGGISGTGNSLEMKITSKIDSEAFKTTILMPYIDLLSSTYKYFTNFLSCCERVKRGVVNARGPGDGLDIKIMSANDSGVLNPLI